MARKKNAHVVVMTLLMFDVQIRRTEILSRTKT